MKVCIDIQPAVSQRAGIGRYVAELVAHLPACADLDFDLFYLDFKAKAAPPQAPHCAFHRFSAVPGMFIQQAWKHLDWPSFNSIAGPSDLYHFTNFIIPPLHSSSRAVVSIHDISFLLHSGFTEKRNLDYLSSRIRSTTSRAAAVMTISKRSADDIHEHLNVPREKITSIYLGVSPRFKPADDAAVRFTRDALSLGRPYILMVGTFEPRKNIQFAVDLFESMEFFDGDLVIAGQKGWNNAGIFDRINQSACKDRIRILSSLPDAHLPALYSGAEFLLMTSFYEGFGFPPLEAMACGTPVISSSGGSLAEVCSKAAVVLDNYNIEQWAEKCRHLLSSSDMRSDLITKGLARASEFTWEKTAMAHIDLYRKAIQ